MSELEVGWVETPGRPWLKTAHVTYVPGATYTFHWGDGATTTETGNIAQHIYRVGEGGTFTFDVRVDVQYPAEKLPAEPKRSFWRRKR